VPISALFSNGSISKRVDLGVATLATSSGTWTTIAGSASAALAVGGLPLGVALTGTLTSTLMDLVISPAQVDHNRPGPAYIDSSAWIDPSVGSLGRGCSIGAGVTIGAGAVIGPNAVVADNSQIGSNAIVGESASVGAGSTLGADAYVDASVVLNAGCQLSAGSTVLYASNLGSGCQVGVEATVRESCVLRGNCTIGVGATLERNVHCGSSVTFAANIDIADGATIPSSTSVTDSIVKCYLLNGTFEYRSLPVSSGPSFVPPPTASVHQDSGARSDGGNAQSSVSTPPADPNNPPSGSGQLPADVGSDVARPTCGGTGQEYMAGTYMCGWFAETLRHKLEDLGYSTSFTVVYRKNPNYSWWKIRSKKWMDGHALTDVHWSNGTTTWIEAQFVGTDGVGQPKLDANGDGKVTHYDHASGDDTTDGDLRIEVYDNRAQAEAAGTSIPGN
jgi:UDP-3-O-[3-hydroxymyristoyl] glucosamine N-acyltransferase